MKPPTIERTVQGAIIYRERPKRGPARKAWDELQKQAGSHFILEMYYMKHRRTWIGIHKAVHSCIRYWPRIPGLVVD